MKKYKLSILAVHSLGIVGFVLMSPVLPDVQAEYCCSQHDQTRILQSPPRRWEVQPLEAASFWLQAFRTLPRKNKIHKVFQPRQIHMATGIEKLPSQVLVEPHFRYTASRMTFFSCKNRWVGQKK